MVQQLEQLVELAEVLAELVAELEARVEIQEPGELEVLLVAVRC